MLVLCQKLYICTYNQQHFYSDRSPSETPGPLLIPPKWICWNRFYLHTDAGIKATVCTHKTITNTFNQSDHRRFNSEVFSTVVNTKMKPVVLWAMKEKQ